VKLVRILFGYAMAIAGLSFALFGPLFWLVTPYPTLGLEPRVAPLPPRIAESIERKRAPPVLQPERVAPTTQADLLPEMNEAPASLPETHVSVALPVEPVAKKHALRARHPATHKPRPTMERNARELVRGPKAPPVTTARTDFPF
jgi:hypothetical protein